MQTINIDGVEYVKKEDIHNFSEFPETEHVAVICDRGWIFEGHATTLYNGGMRLTGAHVVRKWSNGRGIGALAKDEYKDDYTLDEVGAIELYAHAVLAVIPLEW